MTKAYENAVSLVNKIESAAISAGLSLREGALAEELDILVQYLLLTGALTDGELELPELALLEQYTGRVSLLEKLFEAMKVTLTLDELADLDETNAANLLELLKTLFFDRILSFVSVIAMADKAMGYRFGEIIANALGAVVAEVVVADGEISEGEVKANAKLIHEHYYSHYLKAYELLNKQ